jgi:hypothetical protein
LVLDKLLEKPVKSPVFLLDPREFGQFACGELSRIFAAVLRFGHDARNLLIADNVPLFTTVWQPGQGIVVLQGMILCGSLFQTNKTVPGPNALKPHTRKRTEGMDPPANQLTVKPKVFSVSGGVTDTDAGRVTGVLKFTSGPPARQK